MLPAIAEGKLTLALAFEEYNAHKPLAVNTTATASGDTYKISGTKKFVLDGHSADQMIVTAKTSNGISFFLVDPKSSGLTIERKIMMDSRNAATVQLNDVEVSADNMIGTEGQASEVLENVLNKASICLAAEMLGNNTRSL